MSAHCVAGPRPLNTIRLRRIFGIGDASPNADDAWAAHLALKPAEEASSSRSPSAAAVPDVNAPSRTVRPPFRLFDPFSAGLCQFQPTAFKAPVRTPVATEFNSGERIYSSTKSRSPSIGKFVPAANPPRADEVFVNSRALRPTWRQALFQRRFSSSLLRLVRSA